MLDTLTFFYGLNVGETIQVEIETGKTLIIKLVQVSAANEDGIRLVSYEMNGVPREIEIKDVNVKSVTTSRPKVDRSNAKQVGASMPGCVCLESIGRTRKSSSSWGAVARHRSDEDGNDNSSGTRW